MNLSANRARDFIERFAPSGRFSLKGGAFEARLNRLAFSWSVRSALYRHMSVQVGNHIGEIAALETFVRRLKRQKRKSCVAVVEDIIRRMRDGGQLSVALRRWVPMDEALTIAGGETAGRIEQAFDLLVESKARIANVRRTMVSAFTTPLVYL
ncbi:type II secretion system F family protein, partial [Acidithiobacillus ferriphilus]